MYYTGFTERITMCYGIVIKNWPLERFENPSSISTGAAVATLLNSWVSGATHFYRMSVQEFKNWTEAYQASKEGTVSVANHAGSSAVEQGGAEPVNTAPQGIPAPSPTPGAVTAPTAASSTPLPTGTSQFVAMAMVTDANGIAVPVRSRVRKQRSDRGKPRKKRSAVSTGEGSVAI